MAKKARSRSGSVWRLLAVDVGVAIKRNHFLNVARNRIGLATEKTHSFSWSALM